nr:MAG TPA: hypothetical protein [Caudoviricetes sp.]
MGHRRIQPPRLDSKRHPLPQSAQAASGEPVGG